MNNYWFPAIPITFPAPSHGCSFLANQDECLSSQLRNTHYPKQLFLLLARDQGWGAGKRENFSDHLSAPENRNVPCSQRSICFGMFSPLSFLTARYRTTTIRCKPLSSCTATAARRNLLRWERNAYQGPLLSFTPSIPEHNRKTKETKGGYWGFHLSAECQHKGWFVMGTHTQTTQATLCACSAEQPNTELWSQLFHMWSSCVFSASSRSYTQVSLCSL